MKLDDLQYLPEIKPRADAIMRAKPFEKARITTCLDCPVKFDESQEVLVYGRLDNRAVAHNGFRGVYVVFSQSLDIKTRSAVRVEDIADYKR